jgi:cytochrome P450
LTTSGIQAIVDFAKAQIGDTLEQAKADEKLTGRKDFAAKLLRMNQDDPAGFPMVKVFATAITNVGAGSDTTSVSLAAIMYHLMANPACYSKVSTFVSKRISLTTVQLRTELDEAFAAGKLSDPVQYSEAQTLPYLQACIKEGLRMHPATGLPLARVVPLEGATIAGTFFPGGVR